MNVGNSKLTGLNCLLEKVQHNGCNRLRRNDQAAGGDMRDATGVLTSLGY